MAKSGFDTKAVSAGPSPKAPKIGGSSQNGYEKLQQAVALQSLKDMIKNQSKSKERGNIGQEVLNIKESLGREFNPGEKVSIEGASITPNPKLGSSESKAVAGMSVYPSAKKGIIDLIKGGVFDSQKGLIGMGKGVLPNADRTVRQMSVQQKSPLFTSFDSKLQELQSKTKQLKQLMFDISGATLTDNEEAVLGNAFTYEGKSDEQIIADIETADNLVEAKAKLALGGANAGKQMINGLPNDNVTDPPEEQNPQALRDAIKQRFKQRNP